MNAGEVVVREAVAEEADEVAGSYDWLFAPPGAPPDGWDPALAAERVRATIADPRSAMLVAVVEGRIVGLCSAYIDLLSVRYGLRCWVEDLAVDPGIRSRGVGAALLAAAREFARSHGASHLELDSADARIDAHRFYDREGANVHSRSFGWHGLGRRCRARDPLRLHRPRRPTQRRQVDARQRARRREGRDRLRPPADHPPCRPGDRTPLPSEEWQMVLVDLPGVQKPRDVLTERMQRRVEREVADSDAIVFVLNGAQGIGAGDRFIAETMLRAKGANHTA